MKTYIYFVRHAEPDFSIKDDLTRPLTEQGVADAKKVTNALMNRDITAIYSSTYKRAIDTIKDFAENSGLEIITNNDFCERKVGEWVEDFRGFSEKQWQDFDFKLLGGESLREVQERNVTALFNVIRNNFGENVVIGTHGTALSTIINYFNSNFEYADFWRIVDKMPYILCFIFNDMKLESIEEVEFTLM
ncbi:histidine phosphatase family protein [Sporanaerobacter acetigenes]|uniref:2,3-bisphosphoglycerate-dependent phosphoglycerate mutase n=1 Tax=Sporanaerobacter acetigenes DSM 13106 TaxID=1123281 RepID=A0A1M5Z805_9FIRM|nr:histidine phosphatase family protein [Sporanaerobacter acetigenes]SHI20331.1 2,3-bisphosphoglycerate-dependent phosphoglycerate mutase [Sporanaerobacter acetigenes DSM 13106]